MHQYWQSRGRSKHYPPQPDCRPQSSNKSLRNARNNEPAREWSPSVPAFAQTTGEGKGNTAKSQSPRIIWYGSCNKLGFGLFLLIALATSVVVSQHQTEKDATFTQQVMNRFHGVNELHDGTFNKVHHLLYATDISSNDRFTFQNAMKQDDKLAFVDAMENDISDHEKGGNWSIVHCNTLLNKARPIKAI